MARQFLESSTIQAELQLMEKESPAAQLVYYITEYMLPAKIIAQCAGISVQSIYGYAAPAAAAPRISRQCSEQLSAIVNRLAVLAAEGKLDVPGPPRERNEALVALLTVDPSAQ